MRLTVSPKQCGHGHLLLLLLVPHQMQANYLLMPGDGWNGQELAVGLSECTIIITECLSYEEL